MGSDQTFRIVLIATFVVVFLIALSGRLRARTDEKLDRRQEGLFILLTLRPVGLAMWVGIIAYMINPASMAWSALPLPEWVRWTGVAVAVIGGGLLAWTLRSLGKNLTDTVVTRREHSLVTRGPYRWVRHPFYDSVALSVLASGLMMANGFILVAGGLLFLLFAIRTRTEEANLLARFGDSYRTYVERTGRFLPRKVYHVSRLVILFTSLGSVAVLAQGPQQPDWTKLQEETMRHYQALLRFDTMDPPGNEKPVAEYVKQVFDREGIPAQVFSLEPNRPNVTARLKGNGKKRPLLIIGHSDVVNVDPAKWKFPPFSATRDGGYVYGRGTVDDKDNLTATLMVMLELKRLNVPLDRDVIFLSEAGEEGTSRIGMQFMVNQHFPEIDAEYCYAEGGGVTRIGGQVKYATIQTLEKIPYAIELTASGISGHGSVPLRTNPIVHLSAAVAKIGTWKPDIRLNETTGTYFRRLAAISPPADAERYRNVLVPNSKVQADADEFFLDNEPRHASMLRTSISPNILAAGYRVNVIPSEAKATMDVRMLPDEDPAKFLEAVKKVVNDPAVDVHFAARDVRPKQPDARLDSEAFKVIEAAVTKHYNAPTLPTMSTGATDMAYLRTKGLQCFGVGPAADIEDGPKGFGAHSDQERLLESELYRFVRFHWDIVADLARAR